MNTDACTADKQDIKACIYDSLTHLVVSVNALRKSRLARLQPSRISESCLFWALASAWWNGINNATSRWHFYTSSGHRESTT